MREYLLISLTAAVVTYLLTPAVQRFAIRFGAMAAVRDRDVHAIPTPRMGGLAMFGGMVAAAKKIRTRAGTMPPGPPLAMPGAWGADSAEPQPRIGCTHLPRRHHGAPPAPASSAIVSRLRKMPARTLAGS